MPDTFLLMIIIGCEIGFWIVLLAGLAARYLLARKALSTVLLVSVPFIDLILLAATVIDLGRGSTASFAHGLAAAYIGFSVAFGSVTIGWMDTWFAHRFAGGEAPAPAPSHGWALVRYEMVWWLRCVLAVAVTMTLVFAAIHFIDDPARTEELEAWLVLSVFTVVLWFVFGPLWVLLFNLSVPHTQTGKRVQL